VRTVINVVNDLTAVGHVAARLRLRLGPMTGHHGGALAPRVLATRVGVAMRRALLQSMY